MGPFTRLFDSFAAPFFKTGPDGEQLFFPTGVWGTGYRIPNAEKAEDMRRSVRRLYMVFFLVVIPLLSGTLDLKAPYGWLLLLAVAGSVGLATRYWLLWQATGLETTQVHLTQTEVSANQARTLGRGWLIAMIVVSIVLIALFVTMLQTAEDDQDRWIGWAGLAMFVACLGVFVWQLYKLKRIDSGGPR